MPDRHMITGGAGFVAATLARRLIAEGNHVLLIDDLSRGSLANLGDLAGHPRLRFRQIDCADVEALRAATEEWLGTGDHGPDSGGAVVWHLAANSDIPAGIDDPCIDLRRTFLTTFAVLQAMRDLRLRTLHFASSSAIYGDLGDRVAEEDAGPLAPISNYGAMKLASEAQISAAVETFLPRASVFRFPNVVGVPATHGVILELVRKLRADPAVLDVLGDGTQRKPYLHVEELVDAMLFVAARVPGRHVVCNIGPEDDGVTVREIAEAVRDRVSPGAVIRYGPEPRGWVGDVPCFRYSVTRLRDFGWSPRLGSAAAILRAVDEIAGQENA
ncbi:NAD-dependent epimerase/dehydratase family protein [Roseomonas sp. NAR14]|uniref:UDP-glucose 4-epimerase n=1 Tax=Roseomonas acroporae TaxID=2937791 RepID=A0A9X2BWP3_9PROT|nr:NAD-dependent epimerase/dehydratase family protein [Roseomonas acroporae]MCK8785174.1 NAD-dependent epimerase/dehydratase family protein [Roseomonas acroporae]